MVLRSKHSCGFDTFFRPHQIEFAKERGGAPLFDALARPLGLVYYVLVLRGQ